MAEELERCPQGRTDYAACFAPFRYCPVKGCGRAEDSVQLPREGDSSDDLVLRQAAALALWQERWDTLKSNPRDLPFDDLVAEIEDDLPLPSGLASL